MSLRQKKAAAANVMKAQKKGKKTATKSVIKGQKNPQKISARPTVIVEHKQKRAPVLLPAATLRRIPDWVSVGGDPGREPNAAATWAKRSQSEQAYYLVAVLLLHGLMNIGDAVSLTLKQLGPIDPKHPSLRGSVWVYRQKTLKKKKNGDQEGETVLHSIDGFDSEGPREALARLAALAEGGNNLLYAKRFTAYLEGRGLIDRKTKKLLPGHDPNAFIFPGNSAGHLTAEAFRKRIKSSNLQKMGVKAGADIEKFVPRDFRRNGAVRMLEKGVGSCLDIATIAAKLQHEHVTSTPRYLNKVRPEKYGKAHVALTGQLPQFSGGGQKGTVVIKPIARESQKAKEPAAKKMRKASGKRRTAATVTKEKTPDCHFQFCCVCPKCKGVTELRPNRRTAEGHQIGWVLVRSPGNKKSKLVPKVANRGEAVRQLARAATELLGDGSNICPNCSTPVKPKAGQAWHLAGYTPPHRGSGKPPIELAEAKEYLKNWSHKAEK
eukprot:g16562.t1